MNADRFHLSIKYLRSFLCIFLVLYKYTNKEKNMRENANLNTTIKSNKVQCNMCFSVINIFRPGIYVNFLPKIV